MSELSRSPVKLMDSVEVLRPFEFRSRRSLCLARKKHKLVSGSPKDKHTYSWLLKSMDEDSSSGHSVIIEVISQELKKTTRLRPKKPEYPLILLMLKAAGGFIKIYYGIYILSRL